MKYLLDANVLIAAAVVEHEHHAAANAFVADESVALCPLTEGALARFLLRLGEDARSVEAMLRTLHGSSALEWWPADISMAAVDVGGLHGHRQVTDSYLAALAVARGARLATFDRALAERLPQQCHLVPTR